MCVQYIKIFLDFPTTVVDGKCRKLKSLMGGEIKKSKVLFFKINMNLS